MKAIILTLLVSSMALCWADGIDYEEIDNMAADLLDTQNLEPKEDLELEAGSKCSKNTGGSCRYWSCSSWRKSTCSNNQCVCKTGECAKNGKCVKSHSPHSHTPHSHSPHSHSPHSHAPHSHTAKPKYCAHRCNAKRERKNWNFLTKRERDLYIEAVQELYNAGVYTKFVKVHQDAVNDAYAHGSSGFLPWHRKFLMEYENALRCLAPKFECVTIPYWNWGEWQFYCNEQAKVDGIGCTSYQHIPDNMKKDNPNAQSMLAAFGGEGCKDKTRTGLGSGGQDYTCAQLAGYCSDSRWGAQVTAACRATCKACTPSQTPTFGGTGHHAGVACLTTGPFAGWKDWEGLCLSRGVDWYLGDEKNGPLTDKATLLRVTTNDDAYGKTDGYRAAIQGTPHNMAHNYLGGHMRSMRSPMDPIFFSHHAYVDKNWAVWQDCKDHEDLVATKLTKVHYEPLKREMHNGVPLEDDGMDAPMPFKIVGKAFTPGTGCAENAPGGASNPCRDCLGMLQKRNGWCDQRWDPTCATLCANVNCMSKCGTGGTSEDLVTSDFARTDGKKFEYVFNNDKFGETPRHWALAPGRFAQSSFSYMIEGLDRDLTKESCKMMHGNEEAQLSVAELRELEAQNSKSSLFSTDLQTQNSFGSLTKLKGWFDFKAKADKVKKTSPASSSKTVCKKIEQDWVNEQCKSRNDSKMCKRSKSLLDIKTGLVSDLELGSGVKEDCKFSCSGPVAKQPAICGFNAAFNYLMNDAAVTVSDDCVAYAKN